MITEPKKTRAIWVKILIFSQENYAEKSYITIWYFDHFIAWRQIHKHINVNRSKQNTTIRLNSLRLRQNGRHYTDDIFECIFLNESVWISLEISLKFVPEVRINNIPALVQIMSWRGPGDKPLSESMMVSLLTHICVTRPQWGKPSQPPCAFPFWETPESKFGSSCPLWL